MAVVRFLNIIPEPTGARELNMLSDHFTFYHDHGFNKSPWLSAEHNFYYIAADYLSKPEETTKIETSDK